MFLVTSLAKPYNGCACKRLGRVLRSKAGDENGPGTTRGGVPMKPETKFDVEYQPSDDEPFMNPRQLDYFKRKLLAWKGSILAESKGTIETMQADTRNIPDIADRASEETDRALELRTRDRQRKVVSRSTPRCGGSRTAATAIARRPGADLAQAARRAPHRDPEPRGAGASRAQGAGAPRRLSPARPAPGGSGPAFGESGSGEGR